MEVIFTKKDLSEQNMNKKLSEIDAWCFLSKFRETILVANKITYYHIDADVLKMDLLTDIPFKIIKNRYTQRHV